MFSCICGLHLLGAQSPSSPSLPKCDHQKCPQIPSTVTWRAMSPLVENSCFRGYCPQSRSKPTAVQIHDFPKEHNPLENPSTALLIDGVGPQTSKKAFLGTEPDAVEHHPSEQMRTQHLQTGGQVAASHSLCPGGCHREKWAVGMFRPAGGAE